jgi:glucose-6-phosphate-specific signal transduction histidine kinase
MQISGVDFLIGLAAGSVLGVVLTLAAGRLRHWLGHSETYLLRTENQQLHRRLAEKDRHIRRMLSETERLAEKLGKNRDQGPGAREQE